MALKDELTSKVSEFVKDSWGDIPNAYAVPSDTDLSFGNSGKRLDVCVLYADIHRSTEMVDSLSDTMAAEYYKAFLHCAAKIIKSNGGVITAYDGDRVMAIYVGDNKADYAVKSSLEINWAVKNIVNPTFLAAYVDLHRPLQHTVAIDSGTVLVAKTGVRVDSDLVWVGSASNYAAKLNSFDGLDIDYTTRITEDVFNQLSRACLFGNENKPIWEGHYTNMKVKKHYRSKFWQSIP